MYGDFRLSDVTVLAIRNWLHQLPLCFLRFFCNNPAMWQLTSLLSSDKATLSVEQLIKSISYNKCSIFSSLSTVSLTLLSYRSLLSINSWFLYFFPTIFPRSSVDTVQIVVLLDSETSMLKQIHSLPQANLQSMRHDTAVFL